MDPDGIPSLWSQHQCTLDDTAYNQLQELLIRLCNENDRELGRNLALRGASLLFLAKS